MWLSFCNLIGHVRSSTWGQGSATRLTRPFLDFFVGGAGMRETLFLWLSLTYNFTAVSCLNASSLPCCSIWDQAWYSGPEWRWCGVEAEALHEHCQKEASIKYWWYTLILLNNNYYVHVCLVLPCAISLYQIILICPLFAINFTHMWQLQVEMENYSFLDFALL